MSRDDDEWRPDGDADAGIKDEEDFSDDEETDKLNLELEKQHFIDRLRTSLSELKRQQSNSLATTPPPPELNATLFDFQLEGLRWLEALYSCKLNGILADEMGTGKTLQAIAFITQLYHHNNSVTTASLNALVCPLSVVRHWEKEVERFSPQLGAPYVYCGPREERTAKQHEIMAAVHSKPFTIVLSTYEYLVKEVEFFAKIPWLLLVVDEAHRLKNDRSILYGNLMNLNCPAKLLLTVQNNLRELNALLHFCNPQLFSRRANRLERWFANDLGRLSDLIRPLILRRIKEQVVRDLPVKKEILLYTGISATQKRLYRALLTRDWAAVSSGRRQSLSNVLMQLRKCVNHPYQFPGVEPEPFEVGEHLVTVSGKLWMLDKLLALLHRRGHKVLIFSQFTGMLDILQDYLHYRSYNYERLDGSVRGEERYLAIDRFSAGSSGTSSATKNSDKEQEPPFVFLLSTRAGGVGLNLTGADVVVFYDSDFNPQMDLQAAARAHRIGQTKPVLVCRLVSRGTVEELIIRRAQRKLLLTKQVLRDENNLPEAAHPPKSDETALPTEPEEIAEMIKYGLSDLLQTENQSSIDDKDLRQIDVIEQTAVEAAVASAETASVQSAGKDIHGPCASAVPAVTAATTAKPESIYVYGGVDYSKKDNEAFDALPQLVVADETNGSARKRKAPLSFKDEYAELEMLELQAKRQRQKRRQEKLSELWAEANYHSCKLQITEASSSISAAFSADTEDEQELMHFVTGDIGHPDLPPPDIKRLIVIHCVDNSGQWTDRGVFGALTRLCPSIGERYGLAGRMKDLHLGDIHLFPVAEDEMHTSYPTLPPDSLQISIALIVAQKRGRDGNISPIDWQHLQHGLESIAAACAGVNVPDQPITPTCVALPRLTPGGTADWYKTERIIRRYLVDLGRLPTYIYYHPRRRTQPLMEQRVGKPGGNDLFDGCVIFFQPTNSVAERMRLKEYRRRVLAYGGQVVTDPDQATHVVCTHNSDEKYDGSAKIVSEKWLYDSMMAGNLV